MKAADLRAKTADQLKEDLSGLRREQMNLRIQKATGQLKSPASITQVRKDIARLNTVLSEQASGKAPAVKKAAAPKKAAAKKKKESKE